MKVQKSPRLASLAFDEEKYISFLREQGVSDEDIDTLNVFFVEGNEEGTPKLLFGDSITIGHYNPVNAPLFDITSGIYMAPLRTFDTYQLNFTFLHETRHFLQHVVMDFLKRDDLPYEEQPQEIDADNFADDCMERGIQFIGPEDVVKLLQTECPEVFAEWVHTLASMPDEIDRRVAREIASEQY